MKSSGSTSTCSYAAADAPADAAAEAAAEAAADGGAADAAVEGAADAGAPLAVPPLEQAARNALVAVRPAAARKPRLGIARLRDPSQHGVEILLTHDDASSGSRRCGTPCPT